MMILPLRRLICVGMAIFWHTLWKFNHARLQKSMHAPAPGADWSIGILGALQDMKR